APAPEAAPEVPATTEALQAAGAAGSGNGSGPHPAEPERATRGDADDSAFVDATDARSSADVLRRPVRRKV
ncbi:MAG TPA: hypothetical protein VHK88_12965, partial [Aquihabitans sp.]|nr:hypothetical protein [Aquihabitans sp.]